MNITHYLECVLFFNSWKSFLYLNRIHYVVLSTQASLSWSLSRNSLWSFTSKIATKKATKATKATKASKRTTRPTQASSASTVPTDYTVGAGLSLRWVRFNFFSLLKIQGTPGSLRCFPKMYWQHVNDASKRVWAILGFCNCIFISFFAKFPFLARRFVCTRPKI